MNAHKAAIEATMKRHGLPATYTRLDNPIITGSVRVANISFQERPATEPDAIIQMAMRWLVTYADLQAIGINRPYEGDRIEIPAIGILLTVNRYGPRIADGEVLAYDLEATGR